MTPSTRTLYPNAKINLGLRVIERRTDGYHNIETIFYPIGLHDTLQITHQPSDLTTSINFQTDGLVVDCPPEDNLILRAVRQLQKYQNLGTLNIHFHKHIPFGAGLGGGSSDAAHTALAINALCHLNLSEDTLREEVSHLGADCPFFIKNTPCLATGIGDILQPISCPLSGYHLVLVKPDIYVSTKDAYEGITPTPHADSLLSWLQRPIAEWKHGIQNDFEQSVFRRFPAIQQIKSDLYDLGAIYASMSGSGSSVYGIFHPATAPQEEDLHQRFPHTFLYHESLS